MCESAGLEPVGRVTQRLAHPHPKHYVGRGKLEEIKERIALDAIDVVVTDDELAPRMQATLDEELKLKVVDRTAVILDIFAQRARTHEGRIQVELAQYEFTLPRLRTIWEEFDRTGGGIGTRGPGQTQLERDRSRIRRRITQLKREIEQVRQHRQRVRRRRRQGGMPLAALVGYTNVGKTSLLNALTSPSTQRFSKAAPRSPQARTADAPFVTLDPLTRVMEVDGGQQVLVSDTVGFISKLPHALVAAFRATLEELSEADLLLHVVDITDERAEQCADIVRETLGELDLADKPTMLVLNKADNAPIGDVLALLDRIKRGQRENELEPVVTSAETGEGLGILKAGIERWVSSRSPRVHVVIPYERSELVDLFYRRGHPARTGYSERGTEIEGTIPGSLVRVFQPYFDVRPRSGQGEDGPLPDRRLG